MQKPHVLDYIVRPRWTPNGKTYVQNNACAGRDRHRSPQKTSDTRECPPAHDAGEYPRLPGDNNLVSWSHISQISTIPWKPIIAIKSIKLKKIASDCELGAARELGANPRASLVTALSPTPQNEQVQKDLRVLPRRYTR